MADYGLQPTGFNRKRAEDVRRDMIDWLRSPDGFGADVSIEDSPLEQIVGVAAVQLGEVWQALEQIYSSFNPDFATGQALDNILALVGTSRLKDAPSTGVVEIQAYPGGAGTIPAGALVRDSDTGVTFKTTESMVPPGTVPVVALEDGPIDADLDELVDTYIGVTGVVQVGDISLGRFEETDEEARARRAEVFQALGRGTLGAIRAGLLDATKARAVQVIERLSNPPHPYTPYTIECYIYLPDHDQTDEETIARVLWEHASGVQFAGVVVKKVLDSAGVEHEVAWSWVSEIPITVYITVNEYDANEFLPDGPAEVEARVEALIEAAPVGVAVRQLAVLQAVAQVPGVIDASAAVVGSPSGVGVKSVPGDIHVDFT